MDIKGIACAFLRGIYDSFRGMIAIFYLDKQINERKRSRHSPTIRQRHSESSEGFTNRQKTKHEESKVTYNVMQCAVLNGGIFLLSCVFFEYMLLPLINTSIVRIFGPESLMKNVWFWTETVVLAVYKMAWVIPLFCLSRIINAFWFQDIADSAYRHTRGRPSSFPSISMLFADSIFNLIVEFLFLIQASLTLYIPIYLVGNILHIIQMSLLYSLYCFEYKWFNMGWKLHQRLAFLETNWPYFIGFGLPLTIFTSLSNSWIISGCVFSILFPFFIISGNEASPVIGVSEIHLQMFSLVIAVANTILSVTIGRARNYTVASVPAQPRR